MQAPIILRRLDLSLRRTSDLDIHGLTLPLILSLTLIETRLHRLRERLLVRRARARLEHLAKGHRRVCTPHLALRQRPQVEARAQAGEATRTSRRPERELNLQSEALALLERAVLLAVLACVGLGATEQGVLVRLSEVLAGRSRDEETVRHV